MKIYVASSWRNELYDSFIDVLKEEGHEVYDFRNDGFNWDDVDPEYKNWTVLDFTKGMNHPNATRGYLLDIQAIEACDVCILLMNCGRSAHLELGYACASGKKTMVFIPETVYKYPELMWKMADAICVNIGEVLEWLDTFSANIEFEKQIQMEIVSVGKCPTCARELALTIFNDREVLMCPHCQTPLEIPNDYDPETQTESEEDSEDEEEQICRICGCTDSTPCIVPDGYPCHWVEEDLCSVCAEEASHMPPAMLGSLMARVKDEKNAWTKEDLTPSEPPGAIIECSDCGEDKYENDSCPHCGYPVGGYNPTEDMDAEDRGPDEVDPSIL